MLFIASNQSTGSASASDPASSRRPKRRRWRRRLVVSLVALVALAAGGVYTATRPMVLTPLVQWAIEQQTDMIVRIERVELVDRSHVVVTGLSLRDPAMQGTVEPAASITRCAVDLGQPWFRAIISETPVQHVVVQGVGVRLVTDQAGRHNFRSLVRPIDPPDPTQELMPWPTVDVDDITMTWTHVDDIDGRQTMLLDRRIDMAVQLDEGEQAGQMIVKAQASIADSDQRDALPLSAGATIDRLQHTVEAYVEPIDLAELPANLLPESWRTHWRQLRPVGRITRIDGTFDLADPDKATNGIDIELGDIRLTLPIDHPDAPPLVFERIALRVGSRNITCRELVGGFDMVPINADGWYAYGESGGLAVSIHTDPFVLPGTPTYIDALPPVYRKYFDRYSPSGAVNVTTDITRASASAPVRYAGKVELINASAAYHRFALPLEQLTGRIRFSNDRVEVEQIRGLGPSGGEVVIKGFVAPPRDGAQVDLTIDATGIPIDEQLFAAMEPGPKSAVEMFFNEPAWRKLVAAGVLRKPSDADADTDIDGDHRDHRDPLAGGGDGDVPAFVPGGELNGQVRVLRPLGLDADYDTTTTLQAAGLRALFEHWPYPLVGVSGSIVIQRAQVLVRDVVVRGPTGARGTIRGIVQRQPELSPDLTVEQASIPIDDVLIATMPSPQDVWVRKLGLQGRAAGRATVQREPDRIGFAFDFGTEDATLTPFDSGLELTDVVASGKVNRDGLVLDRLTARSSDTEVQASATALWQDQQFTLTLDGKASNFPTDRSALGWVPPDVEAYDAMVRLMDRFTPEGKADVALTLKYRQAGGVDFRLDLEPKQLAADYGGSRHTITDMSGAAMVTADLVEFRNVAGQVDGAQFEVSGSMTIDEPRQASLSFTAKSPRINAATRAVLPEPVTRLFDTLKISAGYRIDGARLLLEPDRDKGTTLEFEAQMHVQDAFATIGVPITKMSGDLGVQVARYAGHDRPYINVHLDRASLLASGRRIEPMTVGLVTVADGKRLSLREMVGTMYGGAVVGRGLIDIADNVGGYSINLSMLEVEVGPFLDPPTPEDRPTRPDGPVLIERGMASGVFTAGLTLASGGQSNSRRGRGGFEVRGARLYDQPLSLAVLQATNFKLPTYRAFDAASARFDIVDDQVVIEDLRLEAPTTAIAGNGTMHWPTRRLDLLMFSRDPTGSNLGPISDLLNVMRDQLIALRITGTLEQPRTENVSLMTIRETWAKLFGLRPRTPDRQPLSTTATPSSDTPSPVIEQRD